MAYKNAFADFYDKDEATVLAIRSDIARLLRGYIRNMGSQTAVANRLRVQQSLISNLVRGNVESLSIEKLIKLCVRAGMAGTAQWGESPDDAEAVAGNWILHVDLTVGDEELSSQGNVLSAIDPENVPIMECIMLGTDVATAFTHTPAVAERTGKPHG